MIYFQSQVDKMLGVLQTENDRLRAAVDYERGRANRAIDELLLEKGSRPVSPPFVKKTEWMKSAMNEISSAGMEVGEPK